MSHNIAVAIIGLSFVLCVGLFGWKAIEAVKSYQTVQAKQIEQALRE